MAKPQIPLFLLLSTLSQFAFGANCDPDFTYLPGLGCYHLADNYTSDYEDAKAYCQGLSGWLVFSAVMNALNMTFLKYHYRLS